MAAYAVSCRPLIRKCTSITFYSVSPVLYFHSTPISSARAELSFTGARLHRGGPSERDGWAGVGGWEWGGILLLWLAKDPSPSERPFPPDRTEKLHPGCRDCTNGRGGTVLSVQTTKTLLDIKKTLSFSRNKKDSRDSHMVIHSINYIVDRTWKYIWYSYI